MDGWCGVTSANSQLWWANFDSFKKRICVACSTKKKSHQVSLNLAQHYSREGQPFIVLSVDWDFNQSIFQRLLQRVSVNRNRLNIEILG